MLQLLAPIYYRNSSGELLDDTRSIRSQVAAAGGEIVDTRCLDQAIRNLKQIDSGIDSDAWSVRNQVIDAGGEVVSFDCLNNTIIQLKSIAV